MEYFEVYLHIIKAKDIKAVERNGKSDPYIKVMAQDVNKKLHKLYKTETIKNTRKPKYHLELILRVPGDTENIVLQLKDWNAVLKDKTLGVVILPLDKMPNHPNVQLHDIDGGGVLKLCTRMLGTRKVIGIGIPPGAWVSALEKTRVHLEHKVYYPGEVVRGYVMCDDRDLRKGEEKDSVTFRVSCVRNNVHYLDIHERFDAIQRAPRLWAFQFLIPKTRIPVDCWSSGKFQFSMWTAQRHLDFSITILPPFEGLEPHLSPRRPHIVAPNSLLVSWVVLPKIIYEDSMEPLKFNLLNSGTATEELKSLKVRLRYQRIETNPEPNMPGGLISKEEVATFSTEDFGAIKLGPSESKEISFVLSPKEPMNRPKFTSAPFEISGDVYELNYFLELEIEPKSGDPIIIDRKPIFCSESDLIREYPPNYQRSMEPDTFHVTTVEERDAFYKLLAPSKVRYLDQLSGPIPDEIYSTRHRETMSRLPSKNEDLPTLASIFDVPFADAC